MTISISRDGGECANTRKASCSLPKCPECGSSRIINDGLRYLGNGETVQRYLCKGCRHRFSIPEETKGFYFNSNRQEDAQVSAILQEAKNLDTPTREIDSLAGEKHNNQGVLVDFAWKLKKRGLKERTITRRTKDLNSLIKKGADLLNTDSVETVLATEQLTTATKANYVEAYRSFTKHFNIPWEPIKVKYQPKQPFLPMVEEVDVLIAGCGKRTAALLQVIKDTGARLGEAAKLQWTDIDEKAQTISVNFAEKGSNSRTIRVTEKTLAMIKGLNKKHGKYLFNPNPQALQSSFEATRKRLAIKVQNPRLQQIHFHTLRHLKATLEYHKTRDILHVKRILGHKRLENTEIYTHLIDFPSDEYHVATANTLKEEQQLIQDGFEFIRYSEKDQLAIYRKRK